MASTQIKGDQVKDGTIGRPKLDITTPGQAVARKIIAGTNVTITEDGADPGTGDVTINFTGGGGAVTVDVVVDNLPNIRADIDRKQTRIDADVANILPDIDRQQTRLDVDVVNLLPDLDKQETRFDVDIVNIRPDVDKAQTRIDADLVNLLTDVDRKETRFNADVANILPDIDKKDTRFDADIANLRADVSRIGADIQHILAGKDTWVTTVALCGDDTNKNGTDLEISSVAATSRDTYFAFDLTNFSTGFTISSAQLVVNRKTVPVINWAFNIFKILNANEGWGETTMICSNRPAADGAVMQTVSGLGATTTGDVTTNLNATAIARLQARLGVGVCTFLIQMSTAVSAATFQSKDSGGTPGNADGPRLRLVLTKNV